MASGHPYPPVSFGWHAGSHLSGACGPSVYPAHAHAYGLVPWHGSEQPLAASYVSEDALRGVADGITPQASLTKESNQGSKASTAGHDAEHRPPPVKETLWTTIASAHKSADRAAVSAAALPSNCARAARPKHAKAHANTSDEASASNRYLLLGEPPAGSPFRSHSRSQASSADDL